MSPYGLLEFHFMELSLFEAYVEPGGIGMPLLPVRWSVLRGGWPGSTGCSGEDGIGRSFRMSRGTLVVAFASWLDVRNESDRMDALLYGCIMIRPSS